MKKKIKNKKSVEIKQTFLSNKPILHITLKSLLIVFLMFSAVYYSDKKGYFNPNELNNHTKKKWDCFYKFTKENNVDILLLGNSHLYSGINPKNLSVNLGVNAFILASPGTNIADTYFALKEALKKTQPKLVVIETYGISNFNPYELEDGDLSDQFKSFYARKDFLTKISSMPFLTSSDNYGYIWSNTLRNHDFIFNDSLQLARNKIIMKQEPEDDDELYLGRFVRFQTGIQKDILKKYDSLGAPVKGAAYSYSEYAELYVYKIVELCKMKDIELMFLTLPMYYKHIDNYAVWNDKLAVLLKKYPNKWLNLQNPYDTIRFTEICFENTYESNQHMTYSGSLIATCKLAKYLKSELKVDLPNRKNEDKWKCMFYGEEGYFENNPVLKIDTVNQLLCEDFHTNNVVLKEVSIIKPTNKPYKTIIAKIAKVDKDYKNCKLKLALSIVDNNQLKLAIIQLDYDIFHEAEELAIFKAKLKPVETKELKEGLLICE